MLLTQRLHHSVLIFLFFFSSVCLSLFFAFLLSCYAYAYTYSYIYVIPNFDEVADHVFFFGKLHLPDFKALHHAGNMTHELRHGTWCFTRLIGWVVTPSYTTSLLPSSG
jgi:hypothetical protein